MSDDRSKRIAVVSSVQSVEYTRITTFLNALVGDSREIIAIMPGHLPPTLRGCVTHYRIDAPSRHFWPSAGLWNAVILVWQRMSRSFKVLRMAIRARPHCCFCAEPDSWLIAVTLRALYRTRVIVDMREVYEDRVLSLPRPLQGMARRFLRSFMKHLSMHTDEIIHVSNERKMLYAYLAKQGVVVASYPDINLFNDIRVMPRQSLRKSGQVRVVHLGALRPTYASDELIAAMEIISAVRHDIRLCVVGGIAGKLKNIDMADHLKNLGTFELHGQTPYRETLCHLFDSDIAINLVSPVDLGTRYAQPQKLYEYMAAGVPVIGADVPTISRVLKDEGCGLIVDPNSAQDIADAIMRLADDSCLREEMGKKGRKAAESAYNWAAQEPTLINIVSALTKEVPHL
jgi:glycosyltransferase involved in cell wall biosynthesis